MGLGLWPQRIPKVLSGKTAPPSLRILVAGEQSPAVCRSSASAPRSLVRLHLVVQGSRGNTLQLYARYETLQLVASALMEDFFT